MTGRSFRLSGSCPKCGADLRVRVNRKAGNLRFLACGAWPECRFTEALEPALEEAVAEARQALGFLEAGRREVRRALFELHPDRNPEPLDAGAATRAVLAIRDALEGGRP